MKRQKSSPRYYLIEAPAGVLAVYDNLGATHDRLTVAFDASVFPPNGMMDGCLSMNEDGSFSQWGYCVRGSHLGRLKPWRMLGKATQRHIINRMMEG